MLGRLVEKEEGSEGEKLSDKTGPVYPLPCANINRILFKILALKDFGFSEPSSNDRTYSSNYRADDYNKKDEAIRKADTDVSIFVW